MKRSAMISLSAAAVGATALPALAQSTETVRFGLVGVEEAAMAFYAQEKGFFKAQGLQIYTPDVAAFRKHVLETGETLLVNEDVAAAAEQYGNPMAINCWFAAAEGISTTGLCHSVQHTADELADIMGLEPGLWSFRAAGINHQAWILDFKHRGRDITAQMRTAAEAYHRGDLTPARPIDEEYAGNREGVRTAIMKLTGYFPTESSHHASEYYPHFRRTPEEVKSYLPERWDYLEITGGNHDAELERLADEFAAGELAVSGEYAARIVDSVLTNTPRVIYGNVPNTGLIPNLPDGCCVEVPCLVDQNGVQPTFAGDLPAACAGINLASVGYQECVVESYRQRSRDLVYTAVSLDRLTSSLLTLDQIREMSGEMIEAQQRWLPELH